MCQICGNHGDAPPPALIKNPILVMEDSKDPQADRPAVLEGVQECVTNTRVQDPSDGDVLSRPDKYVPYTYCITSGDREGEPH